MKDRIPTYPGLVQLTDPDTNESVLRYMTMADVPTEVGTPLNKNTLLSDAAASAVWPVAGDRPSNPLVSEALTENAKGKVVLLVDGQTFTNTTATTKSIDITLSEPFENFSKLEMWIVSDSWVNNGNVYFVDNNNVQTLIGYFNGQHNTDPQKTVFTILYNKAAGYLIFCESCNGLTRTNSGASKLTGNTLRLNMAYGSSSPYSLTYKVYVFGTRK